MSVTPGGDSLWLKVGIFPTRFECIFSSSPLVWSVFYHLPHSFRVYFLKVDNDKKLGEESVLDSDKDPLLPRLTTLVSSVKLENYTRFECKT